MRAVFLDRDGVINKYPGDTKYVTSLKGFCFLPGSRKGLALLYKAGYSIFVISNQAGVGKGVYSQATLDAITKHMLVAVRKAGADIAEVNYCTHKPDANCGCRKPRAGMILRVKQRHKVINLKKTYFIGDTIRDVLTAEDAGCKSILVLSGKEKLRNKKTWESQPHFVFKDLLAAARFIIRQK